MEAVRKVVKASVLTPIIDLPWQSGNMQVEVTVMPLNSIVANFDTPPKITDLKGLGKEVWKDIDVEDYIKKERESWD
jgi:hypothetical protein